MYRALHIATMLCIIFASVCLIIDHHQQDSPHDFAAELAKIKHDTRPHTFATELANLNGNINVDVYEVLQDCMKPYLREKAATSVFLALFLSETPPQKVRGLWEEKLKKCWSKFFDMRDSVGDWLRVRT